MGDDVIPESVYITASTPTQDENQYEYPNLDGNFSYINITYTIASNVSTEVLPLVISSLIVVVKLLIMGSIIIMSCLGNVLVILSVILHRRLQSLANYFLVSLAVADMLVALCAMTFNASVELSGQWLFGSIMCDLWNSFDVYFSTVSILHLCCISVDRYYAIVKPLEYPLAVTRRLVAIMLAQVWILPTLISFFPIFFGWYTTKEHLDYREQNPDSCQFVVNKVYALVSSCISFWVPCCVMVIMYLRIYQEARKQERAIISRASSSCGINSVRHDMTGRQHVLAALQGVPLSVGIGGSARNEFPLRPLPITETPASPGHQPPSAPPGSGASSGIGTSRTSTGGTSLNSCSRPSSIVASTCSRNNSAVSGYSSSRNSSLAANSCSTRRTNGHALLQVASSHPPAFRREHKAARTLGIIMGAFILCWLPFFTWYVTITICGDSCPCPAVVVSILFWIGYFNSTLNPFIYAYFRADFRDAFHQTLRRLNCFRRQELYSSGVFV